MIVVAAIDPGLQGGVVLMGDIPDCMKMWPLPVIGNEYDLKALSEIFESFPKETVVYLERQNPRPGNSAKSTFKSGRLYGCLQAFVYLNGFSLVEIAPQRWTKEMHHGLDQTLDTKVRSLVMAQKLYPNLDLRGSKRAKLPHTGLVDALLLAVYALRHERGKA